MGTATVYLTAEEWGSFVELGNSRSGRRGFGKSCNLYAPRRYISAGWTCATTHRRGDARRRNKRDSSVCLLE